MDAIGAAILGANRSQDLFSQSAAEFINAFTPVLGAASGDVTSLESILQNNASGYNGANPFQGDALAASTFLASTELQLFSPQSADPFQSFVNMMQAQHAYSASLDAFKTASDMDSQLVNLLG